MKKFLLLTAILAMTVMAVPAHADMTYAPAVTNALDHLGNPLVDGTMTMVIDLDGDGWQGNSYLTQGGPGDAATWLWDPDDFIMDISQIGFPLPGFASPFKTITTGAIPASYNAGVDHWYVFWFETPFSASNLAAAGGVYYGVEDMGFVGTNPGDYTPFSVGGNAALQTVTAAPEPISAVLSLLGGGAMALRRRFVRRNA